MLAELKEYVTRFTQFLDLLQVRDNCAKFHHFMLCVTYFREGDPFGFPLSLSCPENTHLDKVQNLMANICFLLTQCEKVIWRAEFAPVIRGDRYQRCLNVIRDDGSFVQYWSFQLSIAIRIQYTIAYQKQAISVLISQW